MTELVRPSRRCRAPAISPCMNAALAIGPQRLIGAVVPADADRPKARGALLIVKSSTVAMGVSRRSLRCTARRSRPAGRPDSDVLQT